jgi:hypothetical protein
VSPADCKNTARVAIDKFVSFGLPWTYVHEVMGSCLTRRSTAVGEFLRSNLHVVTIAVTAGVIVYAAVFLLSTIRPIRSRWRPGPRTADTTRSANKYQELLARSGVELRLVETAGSVENLALLRAPRSGVNIALGGSVGHLTLFYEPL